jgi:hypothetical protein
LKALRPLLHAIRLVFTPLSLLVIAWFVWNSRDTLGAVFAQGQWSPLLLAVLTWIGSNVFAPSVTVSMFRTCGMQIAYTTALRVHLRRLPAKYLPGGIWHSVGRANDYVEMGYPALGLGSLFILENCLLALVTVFISAAIVVDRVTLPWLQPLLAVATPLAGIALVALPFAARRLRIRNVTFALRPYFLTVLLLIFYWLLIGAAFVTFLAAFPELPVQASAVAAAGVYIFSWMVGYLALFAPQGIGVADFVSGSLLSEGGVAGTVLAFLVGFRLLVLVADLLSWAGGLLMGSGNRN